MSNSKNTILNGAATILMFIALFFCLTLTGCSSAQEPVAMLTEPCPETEAATEATETVPEIVSANTVQTPEPTETLPKEMNPQNASAASADRYIAEGESGTVEADFPMTYLLPTVTDDLLDRAAFDAWLQESFADWKNGILHLDLERSDGYSAEEGVHLRYQAAVIGDVLTVMLVENEGKRPFITNSPCFVFNLDTGTALTIEELLEKTGADWDSVREDVTTRMSYHWSREDSKCSDLETLTMLRQRATSLENIRKNSFIVWPGNVDGFAPGKVTLALHVGYNLSQHDDVYTLNTDSGYFYEVVVPTLALDQ